MKNIKIISIQHATHDVMHVRTEKPQGFSYVSGQAVDIAVNKPNWEEKLRAFTFTSLPTDDHLEFFIKTYPEHNGVTEQISKLQAGDSLLIGDVFGDIEYKGEGIFIAGGAGVTPFIAIFKQLENESKVGDNKLIFANKTESDIIEKSYFKNLLEDNFVNVLSDEEKAGFENGYITKEIIKDQISTNSSNFYLCGPPIMMDAVMKQLKELGIDEKKIVKEQF